jgi:hypothetical protein
MENRNNRKLSGVSKKPPSSNFRKVNGSGKGTTGQRSYYSRAG